MCGPLCDPLALAALITEGVGSTVTATIGNKVTSCAATPQAAVTVNGAVRTLTDSESMISGPIYSVQHAFMGHAAVFDTGTLKLVMTARMHEPRDRGESESVGIKPRRARFLLLKPAHALPAGVVPITAA